MRKSTKIIIVAIIIIICLIIGLSIYLWKLTRKIDNGSNIKEGNIAQTTINQSVQ